MLKMKDLDQLIDTISKLNRSNPQKAMNVLDNVHMAKYDDEHILDKVMDNTFYDVISSSVINTKYINNPSGKGRVNHYVKVDDLGLPYKAIDSKDIHNIIRSLIDERDFEVCSGKITSPYWN